jgi:deoxyribodipyrimidine photo-lyase
LRTIIHWFRRDLRLIDNTSLFAAAQEADALVPVYVVSNWRSAHSWTGPMRQNFLCKSLESLDANLASAGSRLFIREGDQVDALLRLASETRASAIHFNRDPDPFGREIERKLELAAKASGIEVRSFKDVAVHERNEVLTNSGTPFRVFTPYSRAWRALPKLPATGKPDLKRCITPNLPKGDLPGFSHWRLVPSGEILDGGERAARQRLKDFVAGLLEYGTRRDIPAGMTTSRLSQDLRFGLLSPREVHRKCVDLADSSELTATQRRSVQTYINELIWREFYMSVLWHWPEVLGVEFNPKFRSLPWNDSQEPLERWKSGETGFPIVDAGMRQLAATGFMHNRVRMITAMFLTKDLQIDWREGERHFMQKLLDGEIASNNGGWQWSAGTGADAAPYFRIQNPWLQSARHDPGGDYIREWLPNLRDVSSAKLHKPPPEGESLTKSYPAPMVDHAVERQRALEMFSSAT